MITEWLAESSLLAASLWQPTLWLVFGLVVARALGRHPARAHHALVCASAGALITPFATRAFGALGWGWRETLPASSKVDGVLPHLDPVGANATGFASLELALLVLSALVSLMLALRLCASWRRTLHSLADARPAPALEATARRLRGGAAPAIEVRESPHVPAPVVWCWRTPARILVPIGFGRDLSEPSRLAVLQHELAHAARRDHWCALLSEVLALVFWWNPLAWLVRHRVEHSAERACDQWALDLGVERCSYARTLLALATHAPGAGLSAASSRRSLEHRIEAILDTARPEPRSGPAWMALVVLATFAGVPGLALAQRPLASPAVTPSGPIPSAWATEIATLVQQDCGVVLLQSELDLGPVVPGETGSGTLWLLNTSPATRVVRAARPDCGCTSVALSADTPLAPGEVVAVPVSMEAPSEPGTRKTKGVKILVAGQAPLELTVTLWTME